MKQIKLVILAVIFSFSIFSCETMKGLVKDNYKGWIDQGVESSKEIAKDKGKEIVGDWVGDEKKDKKEKKEKE